MGTKLYSRLALLLLALGFVLFIALNNLLFGNLRIDLTDNHLYTISEGTRNILAAIDEPISLQLFFSDAASKDVAPLRNYARRVRELLEELQLQSNGKLKVSFIDPLPFSEAEDQAAAFGLQAVPIGAAGDSVYFGLAGTNAYDDHEVIAFLQPDREEYLEYEVAKLINSLVQVEKPLIGLLSSLDIGGGFDMMTRQPKPAWIVIDQIRQSFEVRTIDAESGGIDPDIDVLMVVHPAGFNENMLYAIDQFVLGGGRAMVFVDPYAESARSSANPMMRTAEAESASNLQGLFSAWGIEMPEGKVLGDRANALLINSGQGQAPAPHLAFLALGSDGAASDDIIVQGLEAVNVGAAGIIEKKPEASTEIVPLLVSSKESALLDALQVQVARDPRTLLGGFTPTGEIYTVAARVSGPATSAYEGPFDEGGEHLAASENINVVVVADTDLLADRFWVQVQDFFGQRIATAWADNGAFVLNALDNLSGSGDLISIRSRGRFSRPFTVVQKLRAEAETRNRATADALQHKLDETESRLSELQKTREDQNLLVLSDEQEQALLQFQKEKLEIRRQLREVRRQLDQDIDALGTGLKLINIVLAPLLLTISLWLFHRLLRKWVAYRG